MSAKVTEKFLYRRTLNIEALNHVNDLSVETDQFARDSHRDKENYDSARKKKLKSSQLFSLHPLVKRSLTKDVRQLLQ